MESTAPEAVADSRYARISGTVIGEQPWDVSNEESWTEDGIDHFRGIVGEWTVDWSDPRLPSRMRHRVDYAAYGPDEPDGGFTPYSTSVLLIGDEGSWYGWGRGVGTGDISFVQVELVGEGAYDGLYAIIDREDEVLPDGSVERIYDGFIFEGQLPHLADHVEPFGRVARPSLQPQKARSAQGRAFRDSVSVPWASRPVCG